MKILILGGDGMAGHVAAAYFMGLSDYEVQRTTRRRASKDSVQCDALDFDHVGSILSDWRPDFVINAIGILNQGVDRSLYEGITLNSLLPHFLARELDKYGGKLIHISTDCIFSGTKGGYTEDSPADGLSLYAKTKALGELNETNHLTIRTSIIGPEKKQDGIGLLNWFLKQKGTIYGYTNVWWNGVTTIELAKFIHYAIENELNGLCHLHAPEKVNKYQLLMLFQEFLLKDDVNIRPDGEMVSDKTLISTRKDIVYTVPSYQAMMAELCEWMAHA
ncbi:dTDP-4-dehydrorhamnose reductase family protein [Gracilibacillus sp. Marseille-QA3620]